LLTISRVVEICQFYNFAVETSCHCYLGNCAYLKRDDEYNETVMKTCNETKLTTKLPTSQTIQATNL